MLLSIRPLYGGYDAGLEDNSIAIGLGARVDEGNSLAIGSQA